MGYGNQNFKNGMPPGLEQLSLGSEMQQLPPALQMLNNLQTVPRYDQTGLAATQQPQINPGLNPLMNRPQGMGNKGNRNMTEAPKMEMSYSSYDPNRKALNGAYGGLNRSNPAGRKGGR